MITYQEEAYDDVIDELWPLLESNFAEAVKHKDKFELDPNDGLYTLPVFYLFTAREDNKLVGYAGFFVQASQHYNDAMIAVNDVIYVKDEYRGKDVARSLLLFAEQELEVDLITVCFKKQSNLPISLGYELEEYKYTKYIGDRNG